MISDVQREGVPSCRSAADRATDDLYPSGFFSSFSRRSTFCYDFRDILTGFT